MSGPVAALLGDGRLHLQHGPIDLVIGAVGREDEVLSAYRQVTAAFDGVLERLVSELPLLKSPILPVPPPLEGGGEGEGASRAASRLDVTFPLTPSRQGRGGQKKPQPSGPIARRMVDAVWPHRQVFITPMAAVAGAVADEMLAAMVAGRDLQRAYVNDGGDIAIHLAPGASMRIGVAGTDAHGDPDPALDGFAAIGFDQPARGIATSGRGGRSLSLGIADSVTVLARNAAQADAAATMIGNAVNIDHPAIERLPANQVKDDSDLGELLVTVGVGALPHDAIGAALDAGATETRRLLDLGLIEGALLRLRGSQRVLGGARSLARLADARHPLPTGEGGVESLSRRERVPIASAMGG